MVKVTKTGTAIYPDGYDYGRKISDEQARAEYEIGIRESESGRMAMVLHYAMLTFAFIVILAAVLLALYALAILASPVDITR